MRPMIGAAAVAALAIVGGVVIATSRNNPDAQASHQETSPAASAPAPVVPSTLAAIDPAPPKVEYRITQGPTPARPRTVVKKRSTKKSVAIIGGSTVGGAIVGGVVGGKKGAVIGGVVAGAAGTVYDRKTRKKKVRVE